MPDRVALYKSLADVGQRKNISLLYFILWRMMAFTDFAAETFLGNNVVHLRDISHEVKVTIRLLDLQRIRYIRASEQNMLQCFICCLPYFWTKGRNIFSLYILFFV